MPTIVEESPVTESALKPLNESRVYVLTRGYLFNSNGHDLSAQTARFTATVLLATTPRDFEIDVNGTCHQAGVALLQPYVSKRLFAKGTPFVSLGVSPTHAKYRAFLKLGDNGWCIKSRNELRALTEPLQAARQELSLKQCARLFEQCVDAVVATLPEVEPTDPRILQVLELLAKDHATPFQTLAEVACLSYSRLSHLFSEQMGVSLRKHLLSLKIDATSHALVAGASLTDAAHAGGFCDSAHLSKVWVKAFGAPPTYFMKLGAFAPPSLDA
ncbi:MAG: hypothetical protein RLZZ618_1775 [Pseudomonadota bacterium]